MKENIILTLKTSDINLSDVQADYYNQTVTTARGIIYNNRTGYTWYNVNLKNILGGLYTKYDKFNICLVSVSQSYQAAQTVNNILQLSTNNVVSIKMSGLQWLSSYDQATGNNIDSVVVGLRNFNDNNNNIPQNNYITFLKGSQIVNITINLHSLSNDGPLVSNQNSVFGHMVFLFNITPIIE